MKYSGKAYKFGNNINTDEIIPARYLNAQEPNELGKHCMEDADKNFLERIGKNDIIVGGKNFGCGSSREQAPIAIKACGISCVIAESFARIFYRNAINIGLPIVTSREAANDIDDENKVTVDTQSGVIKNISKKKEYKSETYPVFVQKIIKKGGLLNVIRQ